MRRMERMKRRMRVKKIRKNNGRPVYRGIAR